MNTVNRLRIVFGLILLALVSRPVLAQENSHIDLTGTWRWVDHEDWHDRLLGVDPGQYEGIPLNDAARMRADTYAEEWISTSPLLQCRPRGPNYQPYGLDPMRIDKVVDPLSRQLIAYKFTFEKTPGERMVWLDGRPRLSEYAAHSWEGFSLGKFKGDSLEVTTTHLKESYVTRNGISESFRATVVEQIFLDEPYLHVVFTVLDPDYLTEPLVRSGTYVRAATLLVPPYPCQPEDGLEPGTPYTVPHYLPGENPYLTESAVKFKVPVEGGLRGGAETTYPEWASKAKTMSAPTAQYAFKPVYSDASTRVAELADAQPKRAPAYDKVDSLHVAGDIYLIAGAGGNIAASVGGDGVILVDSGAGAASEKVLAAVRQIAQTLRPAELPEATSPFNSTWQGTHAFPAPKIRMIINTNDNTDHVGGNANIQNSSMFARLGLEVGAAGTGESLSQQILAHANVQRRMLDKKMFDVAPTDTYFNEKYTLWRFLNNQAVQLLHMPNAITDGDSAVFFRHSDVIVAGDIYNSDIYPPIDVDRGGSINGEIESLNKLIDMSVTEFMSQGGTMVIPGHGWISDASDVGYYRDMLIVLRDRIQSLMDKGMTLQQVKAAKPTMDYDPLYGRQPGGTTQFVEAVYRSLNEKKSN